MDNRCPARYDAPLMTLPFFPHRHLLGIAGLQPHEITYLLDEAEQWVTLNRSLTKHDGRLSGLTQIKDRKSVV